MKVIKSEENELKFDNGLCIKGYGDRDCCAYNYIDFEQFPVGSEFKDMTIGELIDSISLKDDGFVLLDINKIPKWAQARSSQNGYYSNRTDLVVAQGEKEIKVKTLDGVIYE